MSLPEPITTIFLVFAALFVAASIARIWWWP